MEKITNKHGKKVVELKNKLKWIRSKNSCAKGVYSESDVEKAVLEFEKEVQYMEPLTQIIIKNAIKKYFGDFP